MEFRWNKTADGWQLVAPEQACDVAPITVRKDGRFWQIYVGNRPLMPGNWINEMGAKRDAWQHVKAHSLEYYGTRRIKLVE